MSKPESYASIWDALADTPEQAANLRTRAELMQQIAAIVKRNWGQIPIKSRSTKLLFEVTQRPALHGR